MSDLRKKLIRLAYQQPELRGDLLPLLKRANDPFSEDWLTDLLSREPSPEEQALTARSKAVQFLKDGVLRRRNELSRSVRGPARLGKYEAPVELPREGPSQC